MRRTQGDHEPIADFLTCIRLFIRATESPIESRGTIKLRELGCEYAAALTNRCTPARHIRFSLENLAARVERSYEAMNQYHARATTGTIDLTRPRVFPPRKAPKTTTAIAAE